MGRDTEEITIRWLGRRLKTKKDELYRNKRPGEQTTASSRYSSFTNTLQEIVWQKNHRNNQEKERLG